MYSPGRSPSTAFDSDQEASYVWLGNSAPTTVAFVDDSLIHVESAARLGLRAIHWHLDEGLSTLRSRLAAHGISADVPRTP